MVKELLLNKKKNTPDERASEILEVILSYARLDFSVKTTISEQEDVFDAIAGGVNMLGEELRASSVSLKEKEQLLKEIHHRVKNNMQIISSLLKLQSENEKDERFLNLIKESQNRIKSIALIHEMLYSTTDFKHTNFKEYVVKLIDSLVKSYSPPEFQAEIEISIDDSICFEIDQMIPMGLIINEVVTNSFKHAFTQKNKGKISISLENKPHQAYKLKIADNGTGLPKDFSVENNTRLGIQLIHLLAEQINSKVEIAVNNGTQYTFIFD